jgi:hypothetical protein
MAAERRAAAARLANEHDAARADAHRHNIKAARAAMAAAEQRLAQADVARGLRRWQRSASGASISILYKELGDGKLRAFEYDELWGATNNFGRA